MSGHIKLKLTKEDFGNTGPNSSMLKRFPHPQSPISIFVKLKKIMILRFFADRYFLGSLYVRLLTFVYSLEN